MHYVTSPARAVPFVCSASGILTHKGVCVPLQRRCNAAATPLQRRCNTSTCPPRVRVSRDGGHLSPSLTASQRSSRPCASRTYRTPSPKEKGGDGVEA